jgi:hypothetical protein
MVERPPGVTSGQRAAIAFLLATVVLVAALGGVLSFI